MARQWTTLLKTLGLNESESAIYLAALEIGSAPAQAIAAKANVSRVTCYSALASLVGKRLVSSFEKGGKTFFTAESPERLIALGQARMKAMEATLNQAGAAVEELKLLQHGEKPVVKVFEGHEALKAIQEDVLANKPNCIYEFGNMDEILRVYSREKDLASYQTALNQLAPKRVLYFLAREQVLRPSSPQMEVMKLPELPQGDFTGDISTYGDRVTLSTFRGKQIAVLIESAELAQTFRAFFHYLRQCLPKEKTPSDTAVPSGRDQ